MAEIKISELTSGSALDGTEVVPIVQDGSTVKVTTQDIADLGGGDVAWGDITGTLANQTDLNSALSGKQEALVSGTNIKTINGTSVLGNGDLTISGGIKGMHALTRIPGTYIGNLIVGTTVFSQNVGYGANYIYFFPFIPANDFSIDEIAIEVSSVLTNNQLKILIFTGDAGPTNSVYESPLLDGTTTGVKSVSTNFSFNAGGLYWLGIVGSAGVQVKGIASFSGAYQFAAQPTGTTGYTGIYYYNAGGINNIPTTITVPPVSQWNTSGIAFFKMRVV